MAVSITEARAIARCNNEVDSLDADTPTHGYIVCYDGTPPDDVNASLGQYTTNNVIVTITLQDPAFGDAAAGGVGATASIAGTPSGNATATGTISFYRAFRGNGTAHHQALCSLAGGGGQMILSTLTIDSIGQTVTINTGTWSERKA